MNSDMNEVIKAAFIIKVDLCNCPRLEQTSRQKGLHHNS